MKKDIFLETRELISNLINVKDPYRIVFTCSATDSLNLAIKGYLKKGDHVIITSLEHNSVIRPLKHMELDGMIELTVVYADKYGYINPEEIRAQIKINTKLIATTQKHITFHILRGPFSPNPIHFYAKYPYTYTRTPYIRIKVDPRGAGIISQYVPWDRF